MTVDQNCRGAGKWFPLRPFFMTIKFLLDGFCGNIKFEPVKKCNAFLSSFFKPTAQKIPCTLFT